MWPNHTPRNWHEHDVQADNDSVEDTIDDNLSSLGAVAEHPVGTKSVGKDGEVKRWVVVMDVSNASHNNEWQVVQEPSNNWVNTSIMDLVDIGLLQFIIAALPSDEVPQDDETEDTEGGGGAPVDDWVAKKEVLDNGVIPAAHAETDVQDWPLPPLRGKVVLLVWIWHEGVVGGGHGDVQVNEVLEERRPVGVGVGSRNCIYVSHELQRNGNKKLTLVVPVSLDVPLGESILRVVLLGTSNLDLLETPLWQVDIAGAKVAAQFSVLQPKSSGQSPDLGAVV